MKNLFVIKKLIIIFLIIIINNNKLLGSGNKIYFGGGFRASNKEFQQPYNNLGDNLTCFFILQPEFSFSNNLKLSFDVGINAPEYWNFFNEYIQRIVYKSSVGVSSATTVSHSISILFGMHLGNQWEEVEWIKTNVGKDKIYSLFVGPGITLNIFKKFRLQYFLNYYYDYSLDRKYDVIRNDDLKTSIQPHNGVIHEFHFFISLP